MKKQLLILTTFFTALVGYSQSVGDTFIDSSITYEITSITPNTVKTISYDVTNGGIDVDIPTSVSNNSISFSVTEIGYETFRNKGLTSLIMPNSILIIASGALAENQLNSIILPNGLTTIEAYGLGGNQLTEIVIPNSVMNLGSSTFINNQLTSFTLSNNVTTLEKDVFKNNQFVNISIPAHVTDIEEGVFRNNQLTNVSFSNGIASIGNAAFMDNILTDISFPSSVVNIQDSAFYNNPLLSVTSYNTSPPSLSFYALGDDRSGIDLTIPTGTSVAYLTGGWTGFNSVTEDASLSTPNFELANNIKVITTTDVIKVISSDSVRFENYILYSISGAKIKEGTESTIAIDEMTKGIYIIKLAFDKGTITKKVAII